jgi:hypothetical protein
MPLCLVPDFKRKPLPLFDAAKIGLSCPFREIQTHKSASMAGLLNLKPVRDSINGAGMTR